MMIRPHHNPAFNAIRFFLFDVCNRDKLAKYECWVVLSKHWLPLPYGKLTTWTKLFSLIFVNATHLHAMWLERKWKFILPLSLNWLVQANFHIHERLTFFWVAFHNQFIFRSLPSMGVKVDCLDMQIMH